MEGPHDRSHSRMQLLIVDAHALPLLGLLIKKPAEFHVGLGLPQCQFAEEHQDGFGLREGQADLQLKIQLSTYYWGSTDGG